MIIRFFNCSCVAELRINVGCCRHNCGQVPIRGVQTLYVAAAIVVADRILKPKVCRTKYVYDISSSVSLNACYYLFSAHSSG